MVFPAHLMGHLLDILIRRLGLLRVDHINIMMPLHTARITLHAVRVKHQYQMHFSKRLIITENIRQPAPGGIQIRSCQIGKFVPCKDDIVAVNQKVLLLPVLTAVVLHLGRRCRLCPDGSGPTLFFRLLCAESTRKDFLHLVLTYKVNRRPAISGPFRIAFRKITRSGAVSRLVIPDAATLSVPGALTVLVAFMIRAVYAAVRQPPPRLQRRLQMHIGFHLVPLHHKSRTVGAEHGTARIVRIVLRLIAGPFYDFLCIVAWFVALQPGKQPPLSTGIGQHFCLIAAKFGNGNRACKMRLLPKSLRRVKPAAHGLHVRHGPSHQRGGKFHAKFINRL